VIAAQPEGGAYTALLLVQVTSAADAAVIDHIVATFIVSDV
jgi:hypothetical protein